MACNCATTAQIEALYKKYGDKDRRKQLNTKEKISYYTKRIGVILAMIPIVPILVLYVLYKGFYDDNHRISFKKFFGLKSNVVLNEFKQNI